MRNGRENIIEPGGDIFIFLTLIYRPRRRAKKRRTAALISSVARSNNRKRDAHYQSVCAVCEGSTLVSAPLISDAFEITLPPSGLRRRGQRAPHANNASLLYSKTDICLSFQVRLARRSGGLRSIREAPDNKAGCKSRDALPSSGRMRHGTALKVVQQTSSKPTA